MEKEQWEKSGFPRKEIYLYLSFLVLTKKINVKQFAILNAHLIKNIVSKYILRDLKIKWPNDLLYKREKICGILQEVIQIDKKSFLIVGVGLNTNFSPNEINFSSTSIKHITKKKVSNTKLLSKIKKEYEDFLEDAKDLTYSEVKKKYT